MLQQQTSKQSIETMASNNLATNNGAAFEQQSNDALVKLLAEHFQSQFSYATAANLSQSQQQSQQQQQQQSTSALQLQLLKSQLATAFCGEQQAAVGQDPHAQHTQQVEQSAPDSQLDGLILAANLSLGHMMQHNQGAAEYLQQQQFAQLPHELSLQQQLSLLAATSAGRFPSNAQAAHSMQQALHAPQHALLLQHQQQQNALFGALQPGLVDAKRNLSSPFDLSAFDVASNQLSAILSHAPFMSGATANQLSGAHSSALARSNAEQLKFGINTILASQPNSKFAASSGNSQQPANYCSINSNKPNLDSNSKLNDELGPTEAELQKRTSDLSSLNAKAGNNKSAADKRGSNRFFSSSPQSVGSIGSAGLQQRPKQFSPASMSSAASRQAALAAVNSQQTRQEQSAFQVQQQQQQQQLRNLPFLAAAAAAGGAFPWTSVSRGKPRRGMMRRAVFSDSQRVGLEKRFQLQKYISKPDRKKLAEKLGLRDSQVKIWFQNRRMKWRNSKERELLSAGGSREQTLPTRSNPNPDLSDVGCGAVPANRVNAANSAQLVTNSQSIDSSVHSMIQRKQSNIKPADESSAQELISQKVSFALNTRDNDEHEVGQDNSSAELDKDVESDIEDDGDDGDDDDDDCDEGSCVDELDVSGGGSSVSDSNCAVSTINENNIIQTINNLTTAAFNATTNKASPTKSSTIATTNPSPTATTATATATTTSTSTTSSILKHKALLFIDAK